MMTDFFHLLINSWKVYALKAHDTLFFLLIKNESIPLENNSAFVY